MDLRHALVALAVPASRAGGSGGGSNRGVRSGRIAPERADGRRGGPLPVGLNDRGASPDGVAREAEGVAGAAERGEDGGVERGGHAVGDGADRVGLGEAGLGRGRGGREGEDGEDEQAAGGHLAGGMGKYFTGSGRAGLRLATEAQIGTGLIYTSGSLHFWIIRLR